MSKLISRLLALIFILSGIFLVSTNKAFALPAFAMREGVSCTLCHTNGSAPHLTQVGFLYRRAGFRFPQNIGNMELDEKNLEILKHFVAGINVDYEVATKKPQGGSESQTLNNFDTRQIALYPLVGAFRGNFASWSEVDFSPGTVGTSSPAGVSTPTKGAASFGMGDLRYVDGNADFFWGLRAGFIAPEGYGASDQTIDDGAIPLMDTLSAVHVGNGTTLDTLTTPLGAMNVPQMGAELEASWPTTFLTLGLYNGFDGTSGYNATGAGTQSVLNPAQMNAQNNGSKDAKIQLDKLWDSFALTAVYYNGRIPLLDPTNTVPWLADYQMARLYGTYFVAPTVLDLMAGVGEGQFAFAPPGSNTPAGHFTNAGAFLAANYYVKTHLTLAAKVDYYQYDTTVSPRPTAQATSLLASLPYENNIFVFHLIRTNDTIAGSTNDVRAEWRFLF